MGTISWEDWTIVSLLLESINETWKYLNCNSTEFKHEFESLHLTISQHSWSYQCVVGE